MESPELCRVAVDRGAQLSFVPYNTNDRYAHLRVRYCAQARAVDTVLIHDLDLELLRRARRSGTVRHWQDRRQDLYNVAWKAQGERREL